MVKSSDLGQLKVKIKLGVEGKMGFMEKTIPEKLNKPTPFPLMSDQMDLAFRV